MANVSKLTVVSRRTQPPTKSKVSASQNANRRLIMEKMASREKLSADLQAHNQSHLVGALDSLQSEEDRQILLQDLQSINLDEMCGNFKRSMGSGTM